MTNKHFNWHKRWSIDLSARTATHESGLVVVFGDGLKFPRPEVGTHCYADGVGEWTGTPHGGDAALTAWLKKNPNLRDARSINARLGRLMEEAGRVWARACASEARS